MLDPLTIALAVALVGSAVLAARALRDARGHRAAVRDLEELARGLRATAEVRQAELERLRDEVVQLEQHAAASAREAEAAAEAAGSLVDDATGLRTAAYFTESLHDRMAAARRHLRPVTVVLVDLAAATPGGRDLEDGDGPVINRCLSRTLRDSDIACRIDARRFGLLLEDTADTSAVWAVERLRRHIQIELPLRVRAGIASYPTHGLAADEVLAHAEAALAETTGPQHDGIQVARSEA